MELKEEWKQFNGYSISNTGRIINKKGKELSNKPDKHGYIGGDINMGEPYGHVAGRHRIVATAFIPNPDNLPEINHKDANKSNNNVSNLEWCDHHHNMLHVRENRLQPLHKLVCLLDEKYNIVETYLSAYDCAIKLEIERHNVCRACRGRAYKINDMIIRFYDEENKTFIETRYDRKEVNLKGKYNRKIECIETGDVTDSQQKMADLLNVPQPKISQNLRGKINDCEGYHFRYIK